MEKRISLVEDTAISRGKDVEAKEHINLYQGECVICDGEAAAAKNKGREKQKEGKYETQSRPSIDHCQHRR